MKVLAAPETDHILGCQIVGSDVPIRIQEVANAITQSIYVHPALLWVLQRAFAWLAV